MGLLKKQWQGRRHILPFLIINLVGGFFNIALAQVDVFAKAFESLDFPMEAITCLVNIFVFGTILLRGRLDLENGAREAMGILTVPKLNTIHGNGLTTCTEKECTERASVVMLSNSRPNWSIKQFMKSNAHIHNVQSILLEFTPERGSCVRNCPCNCIVFSAVQDITSQMPETLSWHDNQRLLPCLTCQRNRCHQGQRLIDEGQRSRESVVDEGQRSIDEEQRSTESVVDEGQRSKESVVYGVLDDIRARSNDPICICIPLNDARHDNWTKLLVRSFKSKDVENRGVTVSASEALEEYLDGNGGRGSTEVYYGIVPFVGPRLSEILINLILTFWFTVDGFSSSLAARRTIRDYLLDSKGNGLVANAFLTKANVKSSADEVCQVLTFRDNCLSVITLSFIAGGVNLICFIGWAVLIAFEGANSAPPLSVPRVVLIIGAVTIALVIDCFYVYSKWMFFEEKPDFRVLVIILEIACIAAGTAVATSLGMSVFGKWIYGVLQGLVWVKWAIGSYILDTHRRQKFGSHWRGLVFSSAFLVNAALAGARSKWSPSWPWEDNNLFSKKHISPCYPPR